MWIHGDGRNTRLGVNGPGGGSVVLAGSPVVGQSCLSPVLSMAAMDLVAGRWLSAGEEDGDEAARARLL